MAVSEECHQQHNKNTTEGPVKSPLSFKARRELVERMAPAYREASRTQKMLLLDTFIALTGYVRTYAMWLLNHLSLIHI